MLRHRAHEGIDKVGRGCAPSVESSRENRDKGEKFLHVRFVRSLTAKVQQSQQKSLYLRFIHLPLYHMITKTMIAACKTLFSTHYHELTEMENTLEGVKNFKVLASEVDKGVVFLHKIARGGTNKSFGIEVAKYAGIPQPVIKRAKEISRMLESNPLTMQKTIFEEDNLLDMSKDNELKDELNSIDVENLTPMQALSKLAHLVELSKR